MQSLSLEFQEDIRQEGGSEVEVAKGGRDAKEMRDNTWASKGFLIEVISLGGPKSTTSTQKEKAMV
ncbi:unnamed protein product [Dovyalis caffra]|uniref:Uncharacterized protein n=1 Tax=Dovyalis caffra TaxID=77055 RepID=A0AAV1R3J2_9ROSI|nr:unnamed protein product [Dovyalis caffra]